MNKKQISKDLVEFYNEHVATGSNISEQAARHGITNTECFQLVKIGERLSTQK